MALIWELAWVPVTLISLRYAELRNVEIPA
jgi:hypothetical protein